MEHCANRVKIVCDVSGRQITQYKIKIPNFPLLKLLNICTNVIGSLRELGVPPLCEVGVSNQRTGCGKLNALNVVVEKMF